ncbi:hypothetical protein FXO37_32469 [Capsicum annuum]|nr:hypothetical protein FXO37_32469 [Capsicum annuum]
MLEIEQPNQEEIHVFVKGQILRFSINEFVLITGLNCFGNVDDFKYEDSSPSRLMKRYFPQSTNGVNKEALVEHFLKGDFENKEDALQMAILYFIHTFIYSQLNASPMPFSDFKMVEDEKYQFFPWGRVSFSRLMASLRQEFLMEKKLYRLGGIPQIDQKFKDLERLMNARFTEVLNSLKQKNENVKLSRQECDPSDTVVYDAGRTSTDSVVKETDKPVEMKDDKSNQAPSFLKKGEQHEKPLESIISGREHDLALTIYKLPPKTPAEYDISDTTILSSFSTPQKNVPANKNAPAPCSRKPSKIYHSPFLTHFGSSSKGKKKLASEERKEFLFEGYHITGDSPIVEMEIFEEWIHDGFYKKHMKKIGKVVDMEKSLINTTKGLSTCAGQPWHMVNEDYGVFVIVYAEYLSEGLGIPCSGIDVQYHRLRYASLLCKYGPEKAENGYFSKNDDPPRPRSKFAQKK